MSFTHYCLISMKYFLSVSYINKQVMGRRHQIMLSKVCWVLGVNTLEERASCNLDEVIEMCLLWKPSLVTENIIKNLKKKWSRMNPATTPVQQLSLKTQDLFSKKRVQSPGHKEHTSFWWWYLSLEASGLLNDLVSLVSKYSLLGWWMIKTS